MTAIIKLIIVMGYIILRVGLIAGAAYTGPSISIVSILLADGCSLGRLQCLAQLYTDTIVHIQEYSVDSLPQHSCSSTEQLCVSNPHSRPLAR